MIQNSSINANNHFNTLWKALNKIYKFYNLLETEIFKISILKHLKIEHFENSSENYSFFNEKCTFSLPKRQKSDSVNHIPNVF